MNNVKRVVRVLHVPLHLMKPVRPNEIVKCLCPKCIGNLVTLNKKEPPIIK